MHNTHSSNNGREWELNSISCWRNTGDSKKNRGSRKHLEMSEMSDGGLLTNNKSTQWARHGLLWFHLQLPATNTHTIQMPDERSMSGRIYTIYEFHAQPQTLMAIYITNSVHYFNVNEVQVIINCKTIWIYWQNSLKISRDATWFT